MENQPFEILRYILSFLEPISQVRISTVNKRWNLAIQENKKKEKKYWEILYGPFKTHERWDIWDMKKCLAWDIWDMKMCTAAQRGYKDLVKFFISKGANDWERGLRGAASGAQKDLIDFFISKGAKDFHMALFFADTKEIKEYLKEKQNKICIKGKK